MSLYCPQDGKVCIDDLCRGSNECFRCHEPLLEKCSACGGFYSIGGGVIDTCDCSPEYSEEDPYNEADI